jgi:HK97 family phage major capsid protein
MQSLQEALRAGGFMSTGPNLMQLKKDHSFALQKAEAITATAENAGRGMTETEEKDFDMAMTAVRALKSQIETKERRNTLRATNQGVTVIEGGRQFQMPASKCLTPGYAEDFHTWLATRGSQVGEHLAEGADGLGGFVLPGFRAASYEGGVDTGAPVTPVTVEQQIIELAPAETGVRKLASVIPTSMDLKLPRKTGFGSVALKDESGASTNLFTDSDATVDQFTLSAFMIGGSHTVSWELLQDVPSFQAFAVNDLLLAQQVYEDNLFVNGTGTGQPQGLLGNVGAGVTDADPDAEGNLLSIQATFDVLGKLNAIYHPGAAWLMSRATGVALRKAQMQANLFAPVWTRVGGQDYLHGYPVEYSAHMPDIAAGATPVLFGNFKLGYTIGDRGGSGVNVKILDQPLATAGQLILLAYRRCDGRVRRSEAIQEITLDASSGS